MSLVNVAVPAAREGGIDTMFRYLMEHMQNIKWVGLAAQSYVVATINGMKIGFIAVCVSHTECAQETVSYPSLSPVKYHENTFTVIVKKLREVNFCFVNFSVVVLGYCKLLFIVTVILSLLHHYIFSMEIPYSYYY